MLNDNYDDLLLKYINLEAEIEIAQIHKLSNKILKSLDMEKQEVKAKLNKFILIQYTQSK